MARPAIAVMIHDAAFLVVVDDNLVVLAIALITFGWNLEHDIAFPHLLKRGTVECFFVLCHHGLSSHQCQ